MFNIISSKSEIKFSTWTVCCSNICHGYMNHKSRKLFCFFFMTTTVTKQWRQCKLFFLHSFAQSRSSGLVYICECFVDFGFWCKNDQRSTSANENEISINRERRCEVGFSGFQLFSLFTFNLTRRCYKNEDERLMVIMIMFV